MIAYALTPRAKADIFGIWSFIARDSEDAAGRVERKTTTPAAFLPRVRCAAIPGRT